MNYLTGIRLNGFPEQSSYDEGLVSNIYTVFEVRDENELLPEYLMSNFTVNSSDIINTEPQNGQGCHHRRND